MNYKKEILLLLDRLATAGIDRAQIERDFEYAENFIDQTLSRGGNKKFLAALKIYAKAMLQNTTSPLAGKNGEEVSLMTIQKALDNVLEQQISTRAEVRSYGQYQIGRDAKGDQKQIVRILAEIGMLVAEHELEISKGGNLAGNGN
jgi:predicted membrane GTPase involved in stress response